MKSLTKPLEDLRRTRPLGWASAHRVAATSICVVVALGTIGATAGAVAIVHQRAVDAWTHTRADLDDVADAATRATEEYAELIEQTQATVQLANDVLAARGGVFDDTTWAPFTDARDRAAADLEAAALEELEARPHPDGTSRRAYEIAADDGREVLEVNRERLAALEERTRCLGTDRDAVLTTGDALAGAVAGDATGRQDSYPDATQEARDALTQTAAATSTALEDPTTDAVLVAVRDYLAAVATAEASNTEGAAARMAAEQAAQAAQAAAQRAAGKPSSAPAPGGSTSSRDSKGNGTAPAPGRAPGGGGGGGGAPALGGGAPAPGTPGGSTGGTGGAPGGGEAARPPQYALQHSTRVASCNPGEHTLSFGPNVNSMPSRYLTVSTSWNGSAWVYSGTTCGT